MLYLRNCTGRVEGDRADCSRASQLGYLVLEDIREACQEDEREDVVLELGGVERATDLAGCVPEPVFERRRIEGAFCHITTAIGGSSSSQRGEKILHPRRASWPVGCGSQRPQNRSCLPVSKDRPRFKYDVAFSLLDADRRVAERIEQQLGELGTFLYATKQEEAVGADGIELYTEVFRNDARLCVVLYREGWGSKGLTSVEQDAIQERRLSEDFSFLLLIMMDSSEPPKWMPRHRIWGRFAQLGVEGTAQTIRSRLAKLDKSDDGPVWRPSESVSGQPLPISYYQRRRGYTSTSQTWVPVRPELCAGCTKSIQYRPVIRVTVFAEEEGDWTTTEQFCPSCARERGFTLAPPEGMSEEEIFAPNNPSFRRHVKRILQVVAESLSDDGEITKRGIDHVGLALTSRSVLALLPMADGSLDRTVSVYLHELEAAEMATEVAIINELKARILRHLDQTEPSA